MNQPELIAKLTAGVAAADRETAKGRVHVWLGLETDGLGIRAVARGKKAWVSLKLVHWRQIVDGDGAIEAAITHAVADIEARRGK